MEIRVDGQQVRRLREAKLWTQADLAERCRVHARTVQRVETEGTASAHTIRAIAGALGVDPPTLEAGRRDDGPVAPAPALLYPWTGVAAAFLWVALSCLVWVPTAEASALASAVAALGFVSFAVGLWCWDRGRRTA